MAKRERRFSLGNLLLVLALAGGIILSALLSVAPHLHEQVHPDAGADHLCLATIFAGGQCENCGSPTVSVGPDLIPSRTPILVPAARIAATRFFNLLEHAPPVLA